MKAQSPEQVLRRLRSALKQAADSTKAPAMQAYMKSVMPYYGITAPILRKVFREVIGDLKFADGDAWRNTVLWVWRNARFREEWYCAVGLCKGHRVEAFQTPEALPMYEELIVSGAWWDVVDDVASHCIGPLLRRQPTEIGRKMRLWSRCDNMWKRRTSIICQLGFKKDTDLRLLYDCIEPSIGSREFFLRKAIGWALRQYAWTDPDEVRRYVRANELRLSPLTRREALKNIQAPGESPVKSGGRARGASA